LADCLKKSAKIRVASQLKGCTMPKLSAQLTVARVKNLKPKDKPYFVSGSDNLPLK